MSKFRVEAGYYEWNIYRDGELIYTIDSGEVTEHAATCSTEATLRSVCDEYVDCINYELQETHELPFPYFNYEDCKAISEALFDAWGEHFDIDSGERTGSARKHVAIVEDGNGKIHIFTKILDERNSWAFEAFRDEVQGWANELSGAILAIYRERDVVQRYSL